MNLSIENLDLLFNINNNNIKINVTDPLDLEFNINNDNTSVDSNDSNDESLEEFINSSNKNDMDLLNNAINCSIQLNKAVALTAQLIVDSNLFEGDKQHVWGGSRPGKAGNKNRHFEKAYVQLIQDYFSGDESTYDEVDFKRRFRVSRKVFIMVYNELNGNYPFTYRKDALGNYGIHPLVRLTACFRSLAYGDSFDREDENLRLSATSQSLSIKYFCILLIDKFGKQFLNRSPNVEEKKRISSINCSRGFPGLFASWDCSHFQWNKCPMALHGQFKNGRYQGKTVVLEAVVDCFLYIWFMNFGSAGTLNDLNVLNRSSIVGSLLDGSFDIKTPTYSINGKKRDYLYFLVDGVYPPWSIFINNYRNNINKKQKTFSRQQEAVRKDVERVFAVLCGKFQVLDRAFRLWKLEDINDLMQTCIILHNMQVIDRVGDIGDDQYQEEVYIERNGNDNNTNNINTNFGESYMFGTEYDQAVNQQISKRIFYIDKKFMDKEMHLELKSDLTEHITNNYDNIRIYK